MSAQRIVLSALGIFAVVIIGFFSFWAIFEYIPGLGVFPLTDISVKKLPVEELIPNQAETVVYADWTKADFSLFEKVIKKSSLYGSLEQLFEKSADSYGGFVSVARDIVPWIGNTISVFTYRKNTEALPTFFLLVETKNTTRTKKVLSKITTPMVEKETVTTRIHNGITVLTSPLSLGALVPGMSPEQSSEEDGNMGISVAQLNNFLILSFGSSIEDVDAVLDLGLGDQQPHLTIPTTFRPGASFITFLQKSREATFQEGTIGTVAFDTGRGELVYQYAPTQQAERGNVVAFTQNLLSQVPKGAKSFVSIPSVSSLFTFPQQNLILPLSFPRSYLQETLEPLLKVSLTGQLFPSIAGEALVITYDDAFGIIAKISNIQQALLSLEALKNSLQEGVNWTKIVKPSYKGNDQIIALPMDTITVDGGSGFASAKEVFLAPGNLGDSFLQDSQPVFLETFPEDAEAIPFSPSWITKDGYLYFFSSRNSLQRFVGELHDKALLQDDKTFVSLLQRMQPIPPKMYAFSYTAQDFFDSSLGAKFPTLVSIPFPLPFYDMVLKELGNIAQSMGMMLYEDTGTVKGKVVISFE